MARASNGTPGRANTQQASGVRSNGTNIVNLNAVRSQRITKENYKSINALMTSDEGRIVLKITVQPELDGLAQPYYTSMDLFELLAWCEAEGNCIIGRRREAELRNKGENIPLMVQTRKFREIDGREKEYFDDAVQSYGIGGWLKHYQQEARLGRNALGLNKSARARMQEEMRRQSDLFGDDGEQGEQSEGASVTDLNAIRDKLEKLRADGLVAR